MNFVRMLRNASANILRVGVNIVSALLLPRLLLGTLSPESYNVWVLIVQIGLYSSYLNLGISTIVGRFVAYYEESGETDERDKTVSSGMAILLTMTFVALVGLVLIVSRLGAFFPDIPAEYLGQAQKTLLLVGAVTALRLPSAILSAVFIGKQRFEFPLVFTLAEKSLVLLFVFAVATMGGDLWQVGIAYSAALLCAYVVEFTCFYRFASDTRIKPSDFHVSTIVNIIKNSAAIALFTLGGLLISGLDIAIVGAFDFAMVAAFSFAVTLTNLVVQVQSAAIGVVMPVAAALTSRRDEERLVKLLVRATRYGVTALYLIGVPLVAMGALVISLWVGPQFVASTGPILVALVIGTIIRQSSLTFSQIAVGVGRQNRIISAPLIGGAVNLGVSIVATMRYGAIGAAIGTIVGAFVEIGLHVFYNLPRIPELPIAPMRFFRESFLYPFLYALPAIVITTLWLWLGSPAEHLVESFVVGVVVFLAVAIPGWFLIIDREDRARLGVFARRFQARLRPSGA